MSCRRRCNFELPEGRSDELTRRRQSGDDVGTMVFTKFHSDREHLVDVSYFELYMVLDLITRRVSLLKLRCQNITPSVTA